MAKENDYLCRLGTKTCVSTWNTTCCCDCDNNDICKVNVRCYNDKNKCGMYDKKKKLYNNVTGKKRKEIRNEI